MIFFFVIWDGIEGAGFNVVILFIVYPWTFVQQAHRVSTSPHFLSL